MTARLASLPERAQVALVAAALLLVAVIGYFAVISPKRSDATNLKHQTASVQAQIDANRSTAFTQALPAIRAAKVFAVAQAMPNDLDTPNVVLTLNALAQDSGINFDQIQPGATSTGSVASAATTDPFAVEPIQLKFSGSFYGMLAFLQRLRNLVRVQNGSLFTAGRLFDVSGVTFDAGPSGFPQIEATLIVNEFVPQSVTATTTPTGTNTTSTTTATTSSPTSAAPSTSGGTS